MSILTEVNSLNNFSKSEKKIAFCLFIVLWIYLFLRAIYVPLLHDEIATFFHYVQANSYMPPNAHWDANNHVLNSMLTNWSYHLFGQSPLALRLPNVLSFGIYFIGAFGISSRLKSIPVRWGLLTTLLMSSYIFEYLGECRGYGMSMSLLLLAIYFVIRLIETNKSKFVLLIGLTLFFVTVANLTLLISSVLIFGFVFLHFLLTDFKANKKQFFIKLIYLFLTGLPFLLLVKLSFKLKELGLLYYGSLQGFRTVTVSSVSERFFGMYNLPIKILLIVFVLFILIGFAIHFKKERKLFSGFSLFTFLLFGCIGMIFILAKFMKVNFPEDRAAMYLFIYLAGAFAFSIDAVFKSVKTSFIPSLFLFALPVYFLFNFSLTSSHFSVEERHSQEIFDIIYNKESDFKFPATVGGYITQELCWYYMNNSNGGKQGRLHWSNHPGLDADFQLVSTEFRFNSETYKYYDSIHRDEKTGLVLFERKNKLAKNLIVSSEFPNTENEAVEYFSFGIFEMDSLIGKTLYVGTELTLKSDAKPFKTWIVASIENAEGKSLGYEFISLDWLNKSYNGEQNNVLQGTLIHDVPEGAHRMKFYLWNIQKQVFSIRDGKTYLYIVDRDY